MGELLTNPIFSEVTKIILIGICTVIAAQVRGVRNRITLMEYKQIAQNHALSKSLQNGYMKDYDAKLSELINDYDFKRGK